MFVGNVARPADRLQMQDLQAEASGERHGEPKLAKES